MNGKSLTYPDVLRRFRQRSNHGDMLGEVENQLSNEIKSLQFVKTCLSIGTGYGEYDIEFIKRCLPNLKKLIVVEKDPNCLKELKVNMRNSFEDKIEIEIHEARIEDFMNENTNRDFKIDLILGLYVLYFLTPESRKDLFKVCFDQWLEPNKGMLIFANPSKKSHFAALYNKVNNKMEAFQDVEIIKKEIGELDLNIIFEKNFSNIFDFREFDMDLYGMLKAISRDITEEMIRGILEEMCPKGSGYDVCQVLVVQKKKSVLVSC